jgi:Gpi18-like mannosyltransferase
VAAVYLPLSFVRTGDLEIFLFPWLRHIKAAGALGAFSEPFSNYSPPYLYLLALVSLLRLPELATIKLLAIGGVCWLAWCMARLTGQLGRDPLRGAERVFLLPTVVFNGPVLGQCDSFWVGCCLLAVSEALRERPYRVAIWAGIAFAFKAQAAFLTPFCAWYVMRSKAWPSVSIPPGIYWIAIAPAALAGWPLLNLLTIYLRQPEFDFFGDAPNLWAIPAALGIPGHDIYLYGYILAAAGAGMILLTRQRDPLDVALLSALLVPFLLPKMLERFFFLADILSLAIAYVRRDRASISVAVAVQLGSFLSIVAYLHQWPWVNAAASIFTGSAVAYVSARGFGILDGGSRRTMGTPNRVRDFTCE